MSNPNTRAPSGLLRFVLTIAVATLFGPLIAGATVFVVMAAVMIAQAGIKAVVSADFLNGLASEFVVMTGAAYLGGAVIAFAAGSIIAIVSLRRKPTLPGVLVAVIVANVGYHAVADAAVTASDSTLPLRKFLMSVLFSIYASAVCWFLFHRLVAGRAIPPGQLSRSRQT